jgi:hypothetical protein
MSKTLVMRPQTRKRKTREILRDKAARAREARRTQRHIVHTVLQCMARGYGE